MAQRNLAETHRKASQGDVLLVIHDFHARSPDELSLTKGDRIELLEKDDDFGDGWYLGKLVQTGASGLFPEVYTTLAPKPPVQQPQPIRANGAGYVAPANLEAPVKTASYKAFDSEVSPRTQDFAADTAAQRSSVPASPQASTASDSESVQVPPLNTGPSPQRVASVPNATFASQPMATGVPAQRSISMMMQGGHHREDSPVIHETLNVIDEHITDMNIPRSTIQQRGHDSGSEYSAQMDPRASYVHGDESDEDERRAFSEDEVSRWTSNQVAKYLESIGVERKHCDIFKEQEISGDILLSLDQASLFMKEFDLGVVGRRLRTWNKIRAFQDEVRSNKDINSRAGDFFDEPEFGGSQGSSARLPRIPSLLNKPGTPSSPHSARPGNSYARPMSQLPSTNASPISTRGFETESGHSRRHSSIDFKTGHIPVVASGPDSTPPSASLPHRKQASLDRDWSLAAATAAITSNETLSPESTEAGVTTPRSERQLSIDDRAEELDRGYMSGGDMDLKKRNVLRKRDTLSATHSRQNSYRDESANLTVSKRHSRFGSAGSIRETISNFASGRSRAQSTKEPPSATSETGREPGPPLVTKLEYPPKAELSTGKSSGDRTPINSPSISSPIGDSMTVKSSPSRTTSAAASTKAGSMDSNESLRKGLTGRTSSGSKSGPRLKHKTKTSAYTRGLRKIGPEEALKECDYSGWMKKKSPGIMAIWRPRLFVLHGRRLAYYYTEGDVEEKGLIDISNHRVLPAEHEFLAGVHAAATRATSVPMSPPNASLETKNDVEVAAQVDKAPASPKSPKIGGGEGSMFIFKLVPPRSGLAKAVQFTRPAVHYFATDNVKQGRLWMAALMKATIDRDPNAPITSTYQQKTISLSKARAMRQRPPALMGVDEELARREAAEADSSAAEPSKEEPIEGAGEAQFGGTEKTEAEKRRSGTETPKAGVPAGSSSNGGVGGLNIEGLDFKPESQLSTVGDGGKQRTESPNRPSVRVVKEVGSSTEAEKAMQDNLAANSTPAPALAPAAPVEEVKETAVAATTG